MRQMPRRPRPEGRRFGASIEEAPMGLRSRFFAFTYDRFSKRSEEAGLAAMRKNLISGASGDVLEIGGGTGANLGYYGAGVESVTITEPEPPMLKRLERKAGEQNSQVTVLRAPA